MTVLAGGLRARLLHDSVLTLVEAGLGALGWFDTGRAHQPVQFIPAPVDWDQAIAFNSLVVSSRSRVSDYVETGSNLTGDTVIIGIDFYGESESLAIDLANDIGDLLRGRLPGGTSAGGTLPILDLRLATPVPTGYATVTDVRVTRIPAQLNRAYTRHWFAVDATIADDYETSEAP
jgi:hypothetical protein